MYKLLIADDEQMIREGLRDIIDWNSLGFKPCAVFEDGQGIIDFLAEERADVVITDIKMLNKSGLDVAKYIYENNLPVKVILISGYKELDFAMSAIKYNVEEYVLKPIDIDILSHSLKKVKQALDEEAKMRAKEISLETMEKNITEIKDQFLAELVTGSFQNKNYIESMFQLVYPNLDIERCSCFLASVIIENYDAFIQHQWEHTSSELYDYLKNFISLASSDIHYTMIAKNNNRVQIFGILVNQGTSNDPSTIIHSTNRKLCSDLYDIFKIQATVSELEIFQNIFDLGHNKTSLQKGILDESLMIKIDEQQKAIYSAIYAGNTDAAHNVIRRFIDYIQGLDISTVHSLIVDLLITINNKLNESSMDTSNSYLIKEGWTQVYELDTLKEIESYLYRILLDLLSIIKETQQDEGNVIEHAKKYIVEHITEDISLEDISEKFYMSQYYFSRTFKARTGENFIDFVIRKKMEYAIKLLKKPQYKIYEISSMVGYKSNRYFTRTFKNYTGYTPRDYRKLLCEDNVECNDGGAVS